MTPPSHPPPVHRLCHPQTHPPPLSTQLEPEPKLMSATTDNSELHITIDRDTITLHVTPDSSGLAYHMPMPVHVARQLVVMLNDAIGHASSS